MDSIAFYSKNDPNNTNYGVVHLKYSNQLSVFYFNLFLSCFMLSMDSYYTINDKCLNSWKNPKNVQNISNTNNRSHKMQHFLRQLLNLWIGLPQRASTYPRRPHSPLTTRIYIVLKVIDSTYKQCSLNKSKAWELNSKNDLV